MDFYRIEAFRNGHGRIEIAPSFQVIKSKDLMIRGGQFYAFWDAENDIWSKDAYRLYEIIDNDIRKYLNDHPEYSHEKVNFISTYKSATAREFQQYIKLLPENWHELDDTITFMDEVIKREDYRSKRVDYVPKKGKTPAYDELVSRLYLPEEREKFEWSIGSILTGDSKNIQKFMVFYGSGGTGKSTIMKIIKRLCIGYTATFDSKALSSNNSSFSLEPFKENPLVAIQDDGDLSRIEDNTKINSIVSHESMTINAKFERLYSMRLNCFLIMGTNKPVKITDAKSGIIRRLIDVHPTGDIFEQSRYEELLDEIEFEISAIAYKCIQVYKERGPRYYTGYKPLDMMYKTDPFFNFVDAYYLTFKNQNSTTLKQAYALYKEWVADGGSDYATTSYKFREMLKDYFEEYYDMAKDAAGNDIRSLYKEFKTDMFKERVRKIESSLPEKIKLTPHESSVLDDALADAPAQYATKDGKPATAWSEVFDSLCNIIPTKLHYVNVPEKLNLIVIDFDLKDENGNKSLKLNLEAASKFPATYTEISQGGHGIHLHYYYDGDVSQLGLIYAENIEIKVFNGNSSLRRKLTKCNDLPIAHIRDGLPLRGEKMLDFKGIENEKHLRAIIAKNLAKQIHPNTKPSMDYIYNALETAYKSGMHYDVSDMRQAIVTLAMSSTNQKEACLKMIPKMHFKSEEPSEDVVWTGNITINMDDDIESRLVFFDVEVFPNLFLVNWKYRGKDKKVHRMINPEPSEMEWLIKQPLVGYNNRRYDNHLIYARMMGYDNMQLYNLSQRIIKSGKKGPKDVYFAEAYNLSYTDIYDYCSKKQTLKLWEIELGIHHEELGLPWDKPVPEELWEKVAKYCDNDVLATEAVFDATQGDFAARKILAMVTHGSPNSTTNNLTTALIFGKDDAKTIKSQLVYTDLSKEFPGYEFKNGKSYYQGYDLEVNEGGIAWSKPGVYGKTKVFDVLSMHPHSIMAMNMFGDVYTARFRELVWARVAAKHKDFEALESLLGGVLVEYAKDDNLRPALVQALKIAINSVYGLTCSGFDHKFRDPRNVDNIVAKRGALFIITLKDAVEKKGYNVIHLKTDSIKVENADDYITEFIYEFGKKYGYEFEVEDEFDRICIINKAEFIAHDNRADEWVPKGKRFAMPYVMKTLCTKKPIEFDDLCVTNSVQTALYLDFNEGLPDASLLSKHLDDIVKVKRVLNGELSAKAVSQKKLDMYRDTTDEEIQSLKDDIAKCHDYRFVGRVGRFVPILPGHGGGELVRSTDIDGKYDSVQGSSGYRWLEAEKVKGTDLEQYVDYGYWNNMYTDMIKAMQEVGDIEGFFETNAVAA